MAVASLRQPFHTYVSIRRIWKEGLIRCFRVWLVSAATSTLFWTDNFSSDWTLRYFPLCERTWHLLCKNFYSKLLDFLSNRPERELCGAVCFFEVRFALFLFNFLKLFWFVSCLFRVRAGLKTNLKSVFACCLLIFMDIVWIKSIESWHSRVGRWKFVCSKSF